VRQNLPVKSAETAYPLLQHVTRKLPAGGHAAVVGKNTFLSNTGNASVASPHRRATVSSVQVCATENCHGPGAEVGHELNSHN
jgi:hypothetical protein